VWWQKYKNRNKVVGDFNIIFKGNIPGVSGMSSSAALENSVVLV
jgi:galactokinase